MSTFACFGMTKSRAVDIARRQVMTIEWNPVRHVDLTVEEWEAKVQAAADKIMESQQETQLSEKYDAPGPAFEYRDLARQYGGRRLHVKAYVRLPPTKEGDKPKHEWREYTERDFEKSRPMRREYEV